jgi:hypothetical protein
MIITGVETFPRTRSPKRTAGSRSRRGPGLGIDPDPDVLRTYQPKT